MPICQNCKSDEKITRAIKILRSGLPDNALSTLLTTDIYDQILRNALSALYCDCS